jgi:hypothetical protein
MDSQQRLAIVVETMKLAQFKYLLAGALKDKHCLPLSSPSSSRATLFVVLIDRAVRVALVGMEGSFI